MKFYQGLLPRQIWDPSNNKVLVEFDRNHEFETEDEDLIKLLRGKGYPIYSDMMELERTGTLPHGGFEKVIEDGDLPSGRSSVEEEMVTGEKPQVRPRKQLPNTEAQDLMGDNKNEPTMNIPEPDPGEKKPKRKIKRRSK